MDDDEDFANMTRGEDRDLARQLAAHPRWHWMPGMSDGADRVVFVDSVHVAVDGGVWRLADGAEMHAPDLDDPATQGCLLEMLRAAAPDTSVRPGPPGPNAGRCWVEWQANGYVHDCFGDRLGEAVARAILAAWGES